MLAIASSHVLAIARPSRETFTSQNCVAVVIWCIQARAGGRAVPFDTFEVSIPRSRWSGPTNNADVLVCAFATSWLYSLETAILHTVGAIPTRRFEYTSPFAVGATMAHLWTVVGRRDTDVAVTSSTGAGAVTAAGADSEVLFRWKFPKDTPTRPFNGFTYFRVHEVRAHHYVDAVYLPRVVLTHPPVIGMCAAAC